MKIKRIISLIESLNNNELKQLMIYLKEGIDINQYPPEVQKAIEKRNVYEISRLIKKGKIDETKEILMIQDEEGKSVAHCLASESRDTKWTTNDKDILMLQDKWGSSVAYLLAFHSDITCWSTDDKDILKLQNYKKWSVAHYLAENHPTWITDDPEILNLKDDIGITVKRILKEKGKI